MRRFKVFTARSALSLILLLVIVNIFVSLYTVHRQDLSQNWAIQDIFSIEAFRPNNHYTIKPYSYSSPIIQKQGCIITVILMEPNFNTAVFASLESVAAFVYPRERTCILIQTSICQYQTNDTVTSERSYQYVIELIHKGAGPIFKDMIQMGNVRVTILDHVKYQLQQCDYFYSPSNPWLNYYYWNDYKTDKNIENGGNTDDRSRSTGEFVPGQDSDFVLTIQKDAVLCTGLDALAWKEYSFVGAPWPPLPTWWSCTQLPANWIYWHSTGYEIPPYPSETDFCTNPNIGPIGNGGLSLRSRYWMQQAIDYCPDADLSGLVNVSTTRTCYTTNTGNEDIYFATIFRGLIHNAHNAYFTGNNRTRMTIDSVTAPSPLKLPSVLEAAFFATETQWLQDVVKHYDIPSWKVDAMVQKMAWWDGKYNRKYMPSSNFKTKVEDGRVRFQRLKSIEEKSLGQKPFMPIGIHKLWKYDGKNQWGEKENLNHFIKECPYLKDIIPKDYYS